MKKSFLLISLLAVSIAASAAVVTPEKAMQVAQSFVPVQKTPLKNASGVAAMPTSQIVYTHYMPKSGRPAIYVVNVGNAFAIVSADDVAHPILGYNYSKSWPTDGNIPPQVKAFFDDLAQQMEAASEHPQDREIATEWRNPSKRKATKLTNTNNLPDSVGPLLTTTWDQGQYYNSLCPEDAQSPYDGHVLTGCVATAMAQIINYWGKQGSLPTRGTHSYESNYGTLEVNYDTTTYDFAHMPDELTSTSTPQEINAVAKLMYHCGVSVNMMYGSQESGAYNEDARAALINFFKVSPDVSFAEKAYFTDEEWTDMIKNDIAAGRPVYYSGNTEQGGGHAFVCNGYKQDGYFYFNFGWSGFSDGWYLTNAVIGFTSYQSAILGVEPDDSSDVILGQTNGTSTFIVEEPLEFYHQMGHNKYIGTNYANLCNNTVIFISSDESKQLVTDILEFEDQNITVYDGPNGEALRSLYAGGANDLSPIVSTSDKLKLAYNGNMYYMGFHLVIGQNSECRKVSNIVSSIDATTVYITWTENGTATQWEIEYGIKGFELGHGTSYLGTTNMATFSNLLKFSEYDFYIRPICGDNQSETWNKITLMVEAPYWQDVVTTQPDGYEVTLDGTILISSPEALAWWAKNPSSTSVKLLADLDMDAYKWKPISMYAQSIDLDGEGHSIDNLHIHEATSAAFFEWATDCNIHNITFKNPQVRGSLRTAVIFSHSANANNIKNTIVDGGYVIGTDLVGIFAGETNASSFVNSCSKNVVAEANRTCGLFAATGNTDFVNCYAHGKVIMHMYCYNAGIMAYKLGGDINRCYSIDMQNGVVGSNQGGLCIDTSSFYSNEGIWELRTPIAFDNEFSNNLLDALNKEVVALGDSTLFTWIAEETTGLPVFGPKHIVTCQEVKNLTAKNIIDETVLKLVVNWEDENASSWQIKIIEKGLSDNHISYLHTSHSKADTVTELVVGKTYEIYVRPVCGEDLGGWGKPFQILHDKPLWTEVITEQPDGFVEDEHGHITISSKEGLAWFTKMSNYYWDKQVELVSDVDLSMYRWSPILEFQGTFDGHNHIISNVYVNSTENMCGFFGSASNATIKNIIMEGGNVIGKGYVGGLLGAGRTNCVVDNCHSSVVVHAEQQSAGSLCGTLNYSVITNCSSKGNVYGREGTGGLIGWLYGGTVKNCFSTSNIYINPNSTTNNWYRGGLIGYFAYSTVENCYTSGLLDESEKLSMAGKVIGCPEHNSHIHYVYALDTNNENMRLLGLDIENVGDTANFHHEDNINTLCTSVFVNGEQRYDLLDALNAWTRNINDPTMKTWVLDETTGFPQLGNNYVPSCYNPTEIKISNATAIGDTIIRTKLEWNQIGEPDHWEVLYVDSEQSKNRGIVLSVNTNPCILDSLPIGKPLDFYARSVCGDGDTSGWSSPITYIPDKLRWTEVVTTQPEGYQEDSDGNVLISSAEGLAWLSSFVNALNNNVNNGSTLFDKKIELLSDIDLSAYRWTPIGSDWEHYFYCRVFEGNNHTISGLYCNDLSDYQGFFGCTSVNIHNLNLNQCIVRGENYVGGMAAYLTGNVMNGSVISGDIVGIDEVGGIVGRHEGTSLKNSYFKGAVASRRDITKSNSMGGYVGGICGSTFHDTVINCYVVSEIADAIPYAGIITGTGGLTNMVANCYYKDYETHLMITRDICTQISNSSFDGSGTTWTLNTPPYIDGAFRTDLLSALNAWVDVNNPEGIYRHWVADTENVNGGFPIFDPTESPTTGIEEQATNANAKAIKLFRNGQIYILRGDRTYTLTGQEVK